ncbi:MAG TPA: glycosyltransferase 87 family protein, partial [Actinopolymorphaceae bacterium]
MSQGPVHGPARGPVREDSLARLATTWLGGPLGTHARSGGSWWTPLTVLFLVTTAVFALGIVQKAPCVEVGYAAQQDEPGYEWRRTERGWNPGVEGWDDRGHSYRHLCYSDVAYLYRERGFADGNVAYLDVGGYPALEYPVLTGLVMQVTAWATQAIGTGRAIADSTVFFGLTVLVLFGFALLTVGLMRRIAPDRPYDALFVAAAPTFALSGTINWDLVAVALTVAALFAWSRHRPVWTGILIGLGAATKLFPLFLLGPLLILAMRTRRMAIWAATALAAVATWLVVNLPIYLVQPGSWGVFWSFNEARGADFGS